MSMTSAWHTTTLKVLITLKYYVTQWDIWLLFAAQLSQRQVPSLIVHPHCASPGGLFGNE